MLILKISHIVFLTHRQHQIQICEKNRSKIMQKATEIAEACCISFWPVLIDSLSETLYFVALLCWFYLWGFTAAVLLWHVSYRVQHKKVGNSMRIYIVLYSKHFLIWAIFSKKYCLHVYILLYITSIYW